MSPQVREMLEAATPLAAKALIDAVAACDKDGDPDHDMRVKAANAIFDRIHGKPAQAITGEDGGPLVIGLDVWESLQHLEPKPGE